LYVDDASAESQRLSIGVGSGWLGAGQSISSILCVLFWLRLPQNACEGTGIDIAAGKYEPDALGCTGVIFTQHCGKPDAGCALGDVMGVGKISAHTLFRFFVRHAEYALDTPQDMFERFIVGR
jgi:hypothetical protein